jgi:hypothetical protein
MHYRRLDGITQPTVTVCVRDEQLPASNRVASLRLDRCHMRCLGLVRIRSRRQDKRYVAICSMTRLDVYSPTTTSLRWPRQTSCCYCLAARHRPSPTAPRDDAGRALRQRPHHQGRYLSVMRSSHPRIFLQRRLIGPALAGFARGVATPSCR